MNCHVLNLYKRYMRNNNNFSDVGIIELSVAQSLLYICMLRRTD